MDHEELQQRVEAAWAQRELLADPAYREAVLAAVDGLDRGQLRVAHKGPDGVWQVAGWLQQAVVLYFAVAEMQLIELGPYEYHDKIPLKRGLEKAGVRLVPPGAVRYGAFLERGCVVMPGYVNIGAHVGAGTMVDTWATVGSCAQIGKGVHISGGVGIGGVLEPPGSRPVIIEDGAFIGSRCIVVEGMLVEEEAVLAANVCLTGSTRIIDVTGSQEVVHKGRVPPRSVVVPGTVLRRFPAGEYAVSCALIIGQRKPSTDRKTTLNQVLRDFALAV